MDSAETWAEAEKLVLPPIKDYESWLELSKLVDGYALCEEMGLNWGEWWQAKRVLYNQTKQPLESVVELLMLLWFEWGYIELGGNKEDFDFIDSILHNIANLTEQVYVTDFDHRKIVLMREY